MDEKNKLNAVFGSTVESIKQSKTNKGFVGSFHLGMDKAEILEKLIGCENA